MPQAIGEVTVLVVAEQEGMPVAFAGIKGQKLEMLFVSAENRGKGIGKRLLQYAVDNHGVSEVVVNEQNAQAVAFICTWGLSARGRTWTNRATRIRYCI